MKRLFIVSAVLFSLSACNTMQGLGQDIRYMGSSLENSANHNKKIARPVQNRSAYTPNPNEVSHEEQHPVEPMETKELEPIPFEKY